MNRKIVLVAGGTASGKTSIAKNLIKIIGENSSTLLEIDNYYLPKSEALAKNKRWNVVNYDNPGSINWDLLLSDLNKLISGKDVMKSLYDYTKENYTKEFITLKANDVIVVEGIFALAVKELVDMADLKIFVKASSDTRLIRRIKRDQEMRFNVKQEKFMDIWRNTLKPAHNKFIEPTSNFAHFVINSETIEENQMVGVLKTLTTLAK